MVVQPTAPLFIRIEHFLENAPFEFPSRIRMLNLLRKKISKGDFCFPWRMENDLFVGISNHEVISKYGVGANCFKNRKWEPHVERVIRNVVKKGEVALDIGANIGYFSSALAQAVGSEGSVFAFEPVAGTYRQLELTKEANKFSNLNLFQCGLGEKPEELEIAYDPLISGNSSLYDRSNQGTQKRRERIQITTLDALYEEGRIPLCDFIKIDVEGHEIQALTGGMKYLQQSCPALLYEFNSETARLAAYSLVDFFELTKQLMSDCQHFLIWGDGFLIQGDLATLKVPLGCHLDLLAVPAQRLPIIERLLNF
jgi:FkbM family methyltransferase